MPNTLAHVGLQGILCRAAIPTADFKWVCLGCVIPDVPWMLQRIVSALGLLDPYAFRLHAIVESSLLACLVLSLSLALLSSEPRRTFLLLGFNSAAHLLLDGLEIKWANGVHFFAPFSWRLWNLGLWWSDSGVILGATLLGVLLFIYSWRQQTLHPVELSVGLQAKTFVALCLLAVYSAAPALLVRGPEEADNHFVRTLRLRDQRPGKPVEFDRRPVIQRGDVAVIETLTGEELILQGVGGSTNGVFSVRGQFIGEDTVKVLQIHEHWPWVRNVSSIVGLVWIGLLWLKSLINSIRLRLHHRASGSE